MNRVIYMLAIYVLTPQGVRYIKDTKANGKFGLTPAIRDAHAFRNVTSDIANILGTNLDKAEVTYGTVAHPRDTTFIKMINSNKTYVEALNAISSLANKYSIEVVPTMSYYVGRKPMLAIMIANCKKGWSVVGRIDGERLIDEDDGEEYNIFLGDQLNNLEINRWIRRIV